MKPKENNIDLALESKIRGSVNRNEIRFNFIDEDEWEEYQDLYEYVIGRENDR